MPFGVNFVKSCGHFILLRIACLNTKPTFHGQTSLQKQASVLRGADQTNSERPLGAGANDATDRTNLSGMN